MSLVKPGKHAAHPERLSEEKYADVYENQNGNLVLCMAFRLDESGHVLRHYFCLAKGGGVNQRTVEDLKARFGWDGVDPFWFETADLSHVQVEAVVEDEPGTDGKVYSRIKWINDPNGRGGSYAPKQVDRRALSTKYGSLFRAVAGPQPMKPATSTPAPSAPPAAPKPPAAPQAAVKPSTLNECWKAMVDASPGETQDAIAADWFALQGEVVPGKTQDDFSPEDWGRLLIRIQKLKADRDNLPY